MLFFEYLLQIVMSNHYFWTWAVEMYFYVIFIYVVLLHCILRDWWWILMREMNICFYLILVMALVQYVPGVNSEQWLFNKHVHILKNDLLRSWLFKLIKELLIIPLNWVQFLSNEKKRVYFVLHSLYLHACPMTTILSANYWFKKTYPEVASKAIWKWGGGG